MATTLSLAIGKIRADDEQWGIADAVNWTVGEHTIRSITAFRDWNNDNFESALRLPAALIDRVTHYDAETVSQELQIISPTGAKFEYVAGFYFYDEDYAIDQNFDLGADLCPAVSNLVQAQVARAAIPQFTAAIVPMLRGNVQLATAIAQAIVVGAITDPAILAAQFGLDGQSAAMLIGAAAQAGVLARAPALGRAAAGQCANGAQTTAVDTQFNQQLTSYTLFGQATVNVTEQLRLTGGIRWTKDDKEGSFISNINNSILAPVSATNPFGLDLRAQENEPDLNLTEEEVTWMANLSYYLTDDLMVFGGASTGFKSGGFNSEGFNSIGLASGASRTFSSETVDNYELGFKSTLLDNRMTANLTLFRTEIEDFQDRQFNGVNFIVQNTGELTQQGVEVDIQVRPIPRFFGLLGVSFLDSDFDSFPNATNLPAVVAAVQETNRGRQRAGLPAGPVPPRDLAGQRNHFSPRWQLSLLGEWTDNLPGVDLSWYVRGEFQYVSTQNVGAETNNNPQSIQSGYETVNARLGIRSAAAGWELAAFVRNAFAEEYCQTIFNQPIGTTLGLVDPTTGGGLQCCVLGAPRTWGVEVAYRF